MSEPEFTLFEDDRVYEDDLGEDLLAMAASVFSKDLFREVARTGQIRAAEKSE